MLSHKPLICTLKVPDVVSKPTRQGRKTRTMVLTDRSCGTTYMYKVINPELRLKKETAQELVFSMSVYRELLRNAGIRVPSSTFVFTADNRTVLNRGDVSFIVEELSTFVGNGKDVLDEIAEVKSKAELSKLYISLLETIYKAVSSETSPRDVKAGIMLNSHPSNFVKVGAECFYVDFFAPMLRSNDNSLRLAAKLEGISEEQANFMFSDKRGIFIVPLIEASLAKPEATRFLGGLTLSFLNYRGEKLTSQYLAETMRRCYENIGFLSGEQLRILREASQSI
ncbi:MAG: hypothetical protein D6769_01180 [Methanobacteriota archaeon]|nr:MAG: hypothetical protein D6769_01180 [Euryarchaeota archaeon]